MDNKKRCKWVDLKSEIYIAYHDNEWGVPVYDDRKLFEMLILESFQAGLSWITILKKREAFKKAYDNFDYNKVINYGEDKIRNKNKIKSSISNAKIFVKIQEEYGSFSNYIWSFTNGEIIKNKDDNFNTTSPLSDKVSMDLKKRGMKYVGSTIIYSYLQAIGIINDHELDCFKYKGSESYSFLTFFSIHSKS